MKPPPERRTQVSPIDIQVASPLWDAEPQSEQAVRAALAIASELAPAAGEVSIVLTDDASIARLNRDWRRIDKPTNVLSFPAAKTDGKGQPVLLGDVIVAHETIAREAKADGKLFLHHLAHIAVHGYLHLLGYDHQTDSEAEAMEGLERDILARMRIPDPYRGDA